MAIEIRTVSTKPQLDVFHRDTQGITYTEIAFDPEKRVVWVTQQDHDNATPMNEYLRQVLTGDLAGHPEEQATREYLAGEHAQSLLATVCEGFEIIWDGNNHVGTLTDAASDAWDDLCNALNDLPDSEWQTWSAGDWLHETINEFVTAETTDDELRTLAGQLEAEAESAHAVILDDVFDYLESVRHEMQEAAE